MQELKSRQVKSVLRRTTSNIGTANLGSLWQRGTVPIENVILASNELYLKQSLWPQLHRSWGQMVHICVCHRWFQYRLVYCTLLSMAGRNPTWQLGRTASSASQLAARKKGVEKRSDVLTTRCSVDLKRPFVHLAHKVKIKIKIISPKHPSTQSFPSLTQSVHLYWPTGHAYFRSAKQWSSFMHGCREDVSRIAYTVAVYSISWKEGGTHLPWGRKYQEPRNPMRTSFSRFKKIQKCRFEFKRTCPPCLPGWPQTCRAAGRRRSRCCRGRSAGRALYQSPESSTLPSPCAALRGGANLIVRKLACKTARHAIWHSWSLALPLEGGSPLADVPSKTHPLWRNKMERSLHWLMVSKRIPSQAIYHTQSPAINKKRMHPVCFICSPLRYV